MAFGNILSLLSSCDYSFVCVFGVLQDPKDRRQGPWLTLPLCGSHIKRWLPTGLFSHLFLTSCTNVQLCICGTFLECWTWCWNHCCFLPFDTFGVAFRLNNEHAALIEAGNQGQKMEGAYSCLQFSSYNQQCCICVAQVLHWNPSPLWTSLLFPNTGSLRSPSK
jgi:hypothetical protein